MKKFLSSLLLSLTVIVTASPAFADEPTNTCPNGQILHQYESATGTVSQNGTPSPTNPIEPTFYHQGDMILRKLGDYADSYDATTGKITRRVGVKALDSTADYTFSEVGDYYRTTVSTGDSKYTDNSLIGLGTHFPYRWQWSSVSAEAFHNGVSITSARNIFFFEFLKTTFESPEDWKTWLAEQEAAGTPVTVYYPLAEAVEEDWTGGTTYCADPIKIATTAYNAAQFAPVEAALESAVTTIKDVVANTIVQADAIQNLQDTKQTMPDASGTNGTCPRFRQCLLIETDDGTPQWFPIIDPFKDFVTPILANINNITGNSNQRRTLGDLDLCHMLPQTNDEVTNTGIAKCTSVDELNSTANDNPEHGALKQNEWGYEFKASDIGANPATDNPNNDEGIVYGISKCVSTEIPAPGFTQPATSTHLNHALWDARPTTMTEASNYKRCWCRITGIVYNGQYYKTSVAPWRYGYAHNSAAECATLCVYNCANWMGGDRNYRTSLISLMQ